MSNVTDFDDLYGSKYLSAADLHGEVLDCTIGKVEIVDLREKDGSTKKKFVAYLIGVDKPLILNKTNAQKLGTAFGKDRVDWKAKQIQLYSEMTSLGKEGVRVRPSKPARDAVLATKLDRLARDDDPISTGRPRKLTDMDDDIPFNPEL
jgi:hypothetical protein